MSEISGIKGDIGLIALCAMVLLVAQIASCTSSASNGYRICSGGLMFHRASVHDEFVQMIDVDGRGVACVERTTDDEAGQP